jgi:hypothetical protein
MPKKSLSITLDDANLLWLRGVAGATGGNLSETIDAIVSNARHAGQVPEGSIRSIVGTVDIAADDEDLAQADAEVTSWLTTSLARPSIVRESRPSLPRQRRSARRG